MLCTLFPTNPRTRPCVAPSRSSLLRSAAFLLAGCDNIVDHRGFAPSPGSVDKLEVETQSREDVVRLIGTPSAVATFNPNVWYYISAEAGVLGAFRSRGSSSRA